jgi:O-antigen/teichoic acid export membrane protein
MVASVLTVALTTRALGVEGYGLLTTAIVFVGLWSSLTELGVGAVIVRRVSSGTGRLDHLVAVNLGLSLVYCLPLALVAALTGLAIYRHQPEFDVALVLVCLTLAPTAVSSCFAPVFMSSMRFASVALADVAARLASLAATVAVAVLDGGLVWFAAVQLVPVVVQLLVLAVAARRITPLRASFHRREALDLLRESLPQTGVLVVGALYWRADAVIITLLGTVRDVGAYGLAYTTAFTASVVSTFFLSSTLSTMTTRFSQDRDAFARFVRSGMETMMFVAVPVAVYGVVLALPVVVLLGGDDFAGSATVPLAILMVSVGMTFLNGVSSQALFAAHDQRFLLQLNLVNLAVNIALNVVLVPLYGAEGSAVSLLVSEVSGLVVTSWRLRRLCPGYRTPWVFLARLALPTGVGVVVALLLRQEPALLAVAATGATYLAANLVLGPVRLATVRRLRAGAGEDQDEGAKA